LAIKNMVIKVFIWNLFLLVYILARGSEVSFLIVSNNPINTNNIDVGWVKSPQGIDNSGYAVIITTPDMVDEVTKKTQKRVIVLPDDIINNKDYYSLIIIAMNREFNTKFLLWSVLFACIFLLLFTDKSRRRFAGLLLGISLSIYIFISILINEQYIFSRWLFIIQESLFITMICALFVILIDNLTY